MFNRLVTKDFKTISYLLIFTIYNQLRYLVSFNYNGYLSDNILIIYVKKIYFNSNIFVIN